MRWKGILVLLLSVPLSVQAGFFDSVINKAKQATENVIHQSVGDVSGVNKSQSTSSPPNDSPKPTTTSVGKTTMTIEEIPTDRRPSTLAALSVTRLRYDQSWLTEKNLIKTTELSIGCQQLWSRQNGLIRGNGCMGEFDPLGSTNTAYKVKLAPVFSDAEISGRNPKFAAEEFKDRMKPALLKLAGHLPPLFGDTVSWRADYDFKQKVLNIKISGYEPGIKSRVPENVRHLDLRNPRRANFDGKAGEYYRLKAWMPYVDGITTLAFDRDLNQGRVSMSPAEAEKLFQGLPQGRITGGTAVVEFRVDRTSGEAAIATLEQVRLLSTGAKKFDLATVKPFMTIPATTFPKLEAPKKKAQTPQKTVPKSVAVKPKPQVNPLAGIGPYQRIEKGQPYGPDIVELKLGMTLAEADKLIREHKKPREVVTGKASKPFVSAKAYPLEPGDESISIFTLNSPVGERIAGYVRYVYFSPDNHPSQIAVAASLEKKYGKPSYSYETPGNFERRWLSNSMGKLGVGDQYGHVEGLDHCEGAARASSGAGIFTGKKQGYPYIWSLPWQQGGSPSGSLWYLKPGNGHIDQPNRCGSVLIALYDDGSSTVTGPTLSLALYDTPWLIEEVNKQKLAEKSQGAKGLDL